MHRPARALQTPPRRANSGPPLPPELYSEPAEEILVVGEMLHDLTTMRDLVASLPFDRDHYRANLRIVAGAAQRTRLRCERLLGEEPDALLLSIPIDKPADPSTIIDDPPVSSEDLTELRHGRTKPGLVIPVERVQRVEPSAALVEDFILETLKERGTATTIELVDHVSAFYQCPKPDVENALARLRVAKRIRAERLGKGIVNRAAD